MFAPFGAKFQRAFCIFVMNFLCSCALFEKQAQTEAEPVKEELDAKEQEALLELKAEVELGRNMAGRLLHFYGVYENEEIASYINDIGNYVASFGDYPDRHYMFQILDTEAVNAFACPGGYILITLGTLRLANNEAELAMILGHEVAHVGKKHMFNTLKNMGDKERDAAVKAVDDKGNAKIPDEMKVRERVKSENSQAGALIARYMSGATGASLGLLQAAKAGMNVILEKGLDKKLEFEADSEGVKYAIRAGYNPNSLIEFLDRLASEKKAKEKIDTKILEKTHPSIPDREKRISLVLKNMNADQILGARAQERFISAMKTMKSKKGSGVKE